MPMVLTMGLRRSLALDAEAEALVSDGARLTRRGMVDRVARLASVLRNLGMQDDDRVAMLAPNGQHYIEFYFGVLWGGGIVVPVNSRFALAEMIEQVRDAEPFALIVDKTFAEMGNALAQSVPSIRARWSLAKPVHRAATFNPSTTRTRFNRSNRCRMHCAARTTLLACSIPAGRPAAPRE